MRLEVRNEPSILVLGSLQPTHQPQEAPKVKHSIFIPRTVWASKTHLKAIKALTYAPVEPHDKATVESNSEALREDCRLISEYIEARFEK